MSHFFASLEGSTTAQDGSERTTRATRGSSAKEGIRAILRSNEGSVQVELYEGDDGTGGLEDRVRIAFQRVRVFTPYHPKTGERWQIHAGQDFELYDGPLSECSFESIRWATQESETGVCPGCGIVHKTPGCPMKVPPPATQETEK